MRENIDFTEMYNLYYHSIYHFLYKRTHQKESAEDLCQETFLKAYKAIDTFEKRASFKTWLYRIAYNTFISWYRKENKFFENNVKEDLLIYEPQSSFLTPEDYINLLTDEEEIQIKFKQLNKNYREVLYLKEHEDLSYKEIAMKLNWNLSKVKSTIYRARKQLKQCG
ncbi:RNA polymerase sigma factor [Bacillus tianshenii]|nr:RNA polymerase sigma factor [Bacillus tianshenii]